MRRTKGRLEGRWAQSCFQRFAEDKPSTRKRARRGRRARAARASPTARRTSASTATELIFTGAEAPEWARGGSYLAVRLIRLKLERWDRLSRPPRSDSIGREKVSGAPLERQEARRRCPTLDSRTPVDAHIRMANPRRPGDEQHRILRRPFVYANGFDDYGLLDSGSVFLAFCRDLERQFATIKRRTHGQDLDEYMVAFGGGYFFCPPGVEGEDDYLARRLVERRLRHTRLRAMPEGNVEILRRAVEALNSADVEAALALMTEDTCFMPLRSRIEGAFNGHDGVRAFFADNEESFEIFQVCHDEIHDFGDRVVAIGRTRLREQGQRRGDRGAERRRGHHARREDRALGGLRRAGAGAGVAGGVARSGARALPPASTRLGMGSVLPAFRHIRVLVRHRTSARDWSAMAAPLPNVARAGPRPASAAGAPSCSVPSHSGGVLYIASGVGRVIRL